MVRSALVQNLTKPVHRSRNCERDAIGRIEGRGLRQHFRKHDDKDRHRDRRVNHAGIAEPAPAARLSPARRSGDIGRIVSGTAARRSSRSRCSSRRLTMPARRFPCFSRRVMLARDEAVSAVSLPAKKAESSRQIRTTTRESQSFVVIARQVYQRETPAPRRRRHYSRQKARPMSRTKIKVSVPRLTFLS